MKKHVLIFGLIPGVSWIALQLYVVSQIYTNPDLETNTLLGFAIMIVIFSVMFVGLRDYRNRRLDGVIRFRTALKAGVLMALVATAAYVGIWMIYYYLFAPDFLEVYSQFALENELASPEYLEMLRAWYGNPLGVIAVTALEILPAGLLVALISALVLKTRRSELETAAAERSKASDGDRPGNPNET